MRTLARYSLCLLLAGCVAQASVNEGKNMDPTQVKMVGREVIVPSGENATVLDWRSDDVGAEEVTITLGLSRPPFDRDSAGVFLRSPLEAYATGNIPCVPYFLVEYGIEGGTFSVIVDALTEQSFAVGASFIRVTALNRNTSPGPALTFSAMVSRGVSKAPALARHSVISRFNPAGGSVIPVQPFARKLHVVRNDAAGNTAPAMQIVFSGNSPAGAIVLQTLSFALGVEAPLLDIPGKATRIGVVNTGAVAADFTITQHLDP